MAPSPPRAHYSEKELRNLYPSNLKLEQVQILLRHGERAPTSARFENTGLAAFWPYCSAAKQLVSVTMSDNSSTWSHSQWRRHLETFDSHDNPVLVSGPRGEIEGMCNHGELTDQGRRSSQALGAYLRSLYIDQLWFLPSTISDPEIVYLRATRIPRAIESLQETFGAMYPPHSRSRIFPPPAIILRARTDETLTPSNGYCKRFAQLARAFSRRSAERWNTSTEMDYVNDLIGKWMPEDGERVAIDSQPRLSGILDTINSTLAHGSGTKLPNEFYDKKGMAIINRLVIEEWFSGYDESQEYRALGIGSLLGDVVSRMILSVEKNSKENSGQIKSLDGTSASINRPNATVKLGLSGCHDTTLAAILTSLGALKLETWPQYTSHVSLELFRKAEEPVSAAWKADRIPSPGGSAPHIRSNDGLRQPFLPSKDTDKEEIVKKAPSIGRKKIDSLQPSARSKLDGYYVRILYNDQSVSIPGCKAPGKHLDGNESFCTLEAFKGIVDKFTPLHWKKDCRSNLNDPTFPVKPEPAGY
ncbi:putative acid phosphatase [Lachnellula hyalina]|uniref:3-phytase n=1 Tax=Lachnellula hyalina TaxID=1316788 RepID=A0A8H8TYG4_9HELO|nr:putative acid phosphatase [Lachnellula hyalina]TVY23891.1 putative acid phosphatase [Lachnellula hyalina]